MKYYAVTDDPTELMHYGIKGMKWGVIRTDAQLGHPKKPKSTRPRSPAYQKASSKLSSLMRNGIQKAQAKWDVYNSPENKQLRQEKREINREIRNFNRSEKLFQKHVQLARQGRLKYKGISDDEVVRINNRLALENAARDKSGREKASFVRRVRESMGEGFVRGVGQGMAGYVTERMTARGRADAAVKQAKKYAEADAIKERKMAEYHDSWSGREAQRIENNYLDRQAEAAAKRNAKAEDIKNEMLLKSSTRREYEKLANESGAKVRKRLSTGERQRLIAGMKDENDKLALEQDLKKLESTEAIRAKYKKGTKEEIDNGDGTKTTITYGNDSSSNDQSSKSNKKPKSTAPNQSQLFPNSTLTYRTHARANRTAKKHSTSTVQRSNDMLNSVIEQELYAERERARNIAARRDRQRREDLNNQRAAQQRANEARARQILMEQGRRINTEGIMQQQQQRANEARARQILMEKGLQINAEGALQQQRERRLFEAASQVQADRARGQEISDWGSRSKPTATRTDLFSPTAAARDSEHRARIDAQNTSERRKRQQRSRRSRN